ncbi:MAG: hypothetical protein ACK6CU_25255 [Deltaproteobacteria bacterium]|jgi:hypothetical protein
MSEPLTSATPHPAAQPRALRILAKSTFRELKSSGYSRSEILAFATEMLSLVSSDLRDGQSIEATAEE